MNTYKFTGKWITHPNLAILEPLKVFHRYLEKPAFKKSSLQNKHILFRKEFTLSSKENTKIFISADDYYKLYINGMFVGCGPKSSYINNYCFNEYDISEFVKIGKNILAVHTYYQGLINRVFISGDDRHGLICDTVQNEKVIFTSDESFLCAFHSGFNNLGTIGYDTQFCESYNANSAEHNFYAPKFDDSSWINAQTKKVSDYILKDTPEKNLTFENIIPKEIIKNDDGYIIDFGKNYVGYLIFTVSGKHKSKIKIRYAQELTCDGKLRYKMRANCVYEDEMILSGKPDESNFFDYKSFRYAQLITEEAAEFFEIHLLARHYPFSAKHSLKSKNAQLKQIYDLCIHTLKYGVQETAQDCPDREKGTYLGDGCYISLSHGKLTGDYTLFKELIKDALRSKFASPSLLTCLNCSLIQEIAEFPLIMVYCLEIYEELTQDKTFIGSVLPEIKNILDYYTNFYTEGSPLICHTDKWCVAEWPDNFRDDYDVKLIQNAEIKETHAIINAYYYKALTAFNFLAEEQVYNTEKLRKEYIRAFYNEDNKRFNDSTSSTHQSLITQLFSMCFGLCDEKTEKEILSLIKEKGLNSFNIFGSFPFLHYLHKKGNKNILKKQILNENAYLKMIDQNATTTFECWDKELKWNTSLFHLTHSSAVMFMTDL